MGIPILWKANPEIKRWFCNVTGYPLEKIGKTADFDASHVGDAGPRPINYNQLTFVTIVGVKLLCPSRRFA